MKEVTYIYPEESVGKTVHREYDCGSEHFTLFTDGSVVQRFASDWSVDSSTAPIENPFVLLNLGIISNEEYEAIILKQSQEIASSQEESDKTKLFALAEKLGYVVIEKKEIA